jgi:hypothetical protein
MQSAIVLEYYGVIQATTQGEEPILLEARKSFALHAAYASLVSALFGRRNKGITPDSHGQVGAAAVSCLLIYHGGL